MTDPRRDRWSKPIKDPSNVLYLDWEGTIAEPAALLGVLDPLDGAWHTRQYAFSEPLRMAAAATGAAIADRRVDEVVAELFERSDRHGATVVSWTEHDRRVLEDLHGTAPLRYRNAKRAIERRRKRAGLDFEGELQWHLDRIGFDRPEAIRSGAAGWIATIRERTRAHDRWEDVTDLTKEAWAKLLAHNETDLWGLKAVVEAEFGSPDDSPTTTPADADEPAASRSRRGSSEPPEVDRLRRGPARRRWAGGLPPRLEPADFDDAHLVEHDGRGLLWLPGLRVFVQFPVSATRRPLAALVRNPAARWASPEDVVALGEPEVGPLVRRVLEATADTDEALAELLVIHDWDRHGPQPPGTASIGARPRPRPPVLEGGAALDLPRARRTTP